MVYEVSKATHIQTRVWNETAILPGYCLWPQLQNPLELGDGAVLASLGIWR